MKIKDLLSVIDFSRNKWLNVGYFDEHNQFIVIIEYCSNDIDIKNENAKEVVIMNDTIDKIWSVPSLNELFATIILKEDKGEVV